MFETSALSTRLGVKPLHAVCRLWFSKREPPMQQLQFGNTDNLSSTLCYGVGSKA
jgi:hypothetical protein